MSTTVREPSTSSFMPARGAPLSGYLIFGVGVGLLIALRIPFAVPLFFILPIAYMVLGSRWNHRLWERRWKTLPERGTTLETTAAWVLAGLLIAAAVASSLGEEVLPWVLFGLQVLVTAIAIPVTLHRYPGIS